MMNMHYRQPGIWEQRDLDPQGRQVGSTLVRGPSKKIHIVDSSGYTGKREKVSPPVIHPYGLNVQDLELSGSYSHVQPNGYKTVGQGDQLADTAANGFGIDAYDTSSLSNRALDEFNDKARGDLDLSVDIAEAHQTARMFRAAERVEDYTRVFTRRFGAIKTLGNAWLEYTYGVKPLVQDVYAAADESTRVVINKIERFSARASEYYEPSNVSMPTLWGARSIKCSGRIKFSVTYGACLSTEEWDPGRWSSLNPLSIAWELTPYSFVADWFLNVGGYLRNYETSLLYANRFRSGYRTRLTAAELSILTSTKTVNSDGSVDTWFYQGSARNRDIRREVLTAYPSPYLPSFRARLGSSRLLSAASLVTTLLSSGGNPVRRSKELNRKVRKDLQRRAKPVGNVSLWQREYMHL